MLAVSDSVGNSSDHNRGGGHKYIPVQTRGLVYIYKLVNLLPFNATVEVGCTLCLLHLQAGLP